jgi:hypothetical protein
MMPVDGNEDFYECSFVCHHLTANILIFSSYFGLLGRPMYYPQLLCPRRDYKAMPLQNRNE